MNAPDHLAKQIIAGAISIALAAVALSLAAPRAVHAAVAALVGIANTPANPVPSNEVNQSAARLVDIFCQVWSSLLPYTTRRGGSMAR